MASTCLLGALIPVALASSGITYNFVTNGPDFLLDNGAVLFLSPVDDQNDIDALIGFEARIENLDDFR